MCKRGYNTYNARWISPTYKLVLYYSDVANNNVYMLPIKYYKNALQYLINSESKKYLITFSTNGLLFAEKWHCNI